MDEDDRKDKIVIFSTPMSKENLWLDMYNKFQKQWEEGAKLPPHLLGIDWAEDSGMNRGDIHKREGNVIHVRFKAVSA